MFSKITKKNWLFFAIKNYNVPNLDSEQEFYEDVKRFKYLKRLFRKYKATRILGYIKNFFSIFKYNKRRRIAKCKSQYKFVN